VRFGRIARSCRGTVCRSHHNRDDAVGRRHPCRCAAPPMAAGWREVPVNLRVSWSSPSSVERGTQYPRAPEPEAGGVGTDADNATQPTPAARHRRQTPPPELHVGEAHDADGCRRTLGPTRGRAYASAANGETNMLLFTGMIPPVLNAECYRSPNESVEPSARAKSSSISRCRSGLRHVANVPLVALISTASASSARTAGRTRGDHMLEQSHRVARHARTVTPLPFAATPSALVWTSCRTRRSWR
jgi:hypothetical protein